MLVASVLHVTEATFPAHFSVALPPFPSWFHWSALPGPELWISLGKVGQNSVAGQRLWLFASGRSHQMVTVLALDRELLLRS